mmetsp:Transcript_22825/g.61059  ORF Transcript_22825/g.61059 Transcript_22825/m.61059 type:complete len:283 (+) Transcript_22825:474-1322(+)
MAVPHRLHDRDAVRLQPPEQLRQSLSHGRVEEHVPAVVHADDPLRVVAGLLQAVVLHQRLREVRGRRLHPLRGVQLRERGDPGDAVNVDQPAPPPQLLHPGSPCEGAVEVIQVDLVNAQAVDVVPEPELRVPWDGPVHACEVEHLLGAQRRLDGGPPEARERHPQRHVGHVGVGGRRALKPDGPWWWTPLRRGRRWRAADVQDWRGVGPDHLLHQAEAEGFGQEARLGSFALEHAVEHPRLPVGRDAHVRALQASPLGVLPHNLAVQAVETEVRLQNDQRHL